MREFVAPAPTPLSPDRHLPQLDAVRCIAVIIVIWSHTAGQHLPAVGRVGIGVFGVWLFFVLSGYLITGILLRASSARAAGPRRRVLFAFYARRFLRIFPAYYLLLAVGSLLAVSPSFRADWPWHVTYTSNWLMAERAQWGGAVGPLWSLGVEEQFYLVWPLLLLTVPRRSLPGVFTALIFVGIVSRAFVVRMAFHGGSVIPLLAPTPTNLDPLALGALLAWAHAGHVSVDTTLRATRAALVVGTCMTLYSLLWSLHVFAHGRAIVSITEALGGGLLGVYIVDRAARGVSQATAIGRALSAPSVQYVGRISYGIYLWHMLLLTVLQRRIPTFRSPFFSTRVGFMIWFVTVAAASIAVATVSWYLYERPINSLKTRFQYPRAHASASSDSSELEQPAVAATAIPATAIPASPVPTPG